ncbi:MAG: UbiA family prenyltransferase [Chitinophagaceae bacterium]
MVLQRLKKITAFLVYSNLFIAVCALALTVETFVLLQLPQSVNWYAPLLFCCTLFVYCLHYWAKSKKDKTDSRLEWCRKNKMLLLVFLSASALIISAIVIYHRNDIFYRDGVFNYKNLALFILIPLLALGYSHPLTPWNKKGLRQVGWLKLVSLSFTWGFTTTLLPVWMLLPGNMNSFQLAILFLHRFFFIASLCVLFNINDHEEDKKDGVRTIAVSAGPEKSLRYGKWFTLFINSVMAVLLLCYFKLNQPVFFIALLLPVVLVFWLYHRFMASKEEALFVLQHDGMMIVKALLLIFALLTRSL